MKTILDDEADFVIVGSGAGGATAARVLAASGQSVIVVEEGPQVRTADRPRALLDAMTLAMRDAGSQATTGTTPLPLLQGRLVGGSTAINSGIIWRTPDDVRQAWTDQHGLGPLLDPRRLRQAFETIEAELEITETRDAVRGGNAHVMADACDALGLPGRPTVRNARACQGSARCLQGCPHEARQSLDVSYIPRALRDGAQLYSSCRVERLCLQRGRATGVTGRVLEPHAGRRRGRFMFHARRAVIVAAGALHTPLLLLRSGIRGVVGENFQAHPGCAVVGRFPFEVGLGHGATQGYEVPMREEGFKLESLSLPPELLATRIPGAGSTWQRRLAGMQYYAQWVAQVRMETVGHVRAGWNGRPVVRYRPTPTDLRKTQRAVTLLCRMMFAAGATEVYPGLGGAPDVLHRAQDVAAIEQSSFKRKHFHLLASHLFGTARAGSQPSTSVVRPDLRSHEVPQLYVMDGSALPTNMGVNPQHSIMTLAWQAAERLC